MCTNVVVAYVKSLSLHSFVMASKLITKKKVYASFLMVGSPKSLSRKFKSLVMYDYTRITNDQVDVPYGLLLLVCVILTI